MPCRQVVHVFNTYQMSSGICTVIISTLRIYDINSLYDKQFDGGGGGYRCNCIMIYLNTDIVQPNAYVGIGLFRIYFT